jgi:hypothetical protein
MFEKEASLKGTSEFRHNKGKNLNCDSNGVTDKIKGGCLLKWELLFLPGPYYQPDFKLLVL